MRFESNGLSDHHLAGVFVFRQSAERLSEKGQQIVEPEHYTACAADGTGYVLMDKESAATERDISVTKQYVLCFL